MTWGNVVSEGRLQPLTHTALDQGGSGSLQPEAPRFAWSAPHDGVFGPHNMGRQTVVNSHATEEETTCSSRADRSGEHAELLIQGTIQVDLGRGKADLGDAIAVTDRGAGVSRDAPPNLVDHRVVHRSGPQVLEVQE